MKIRVGDNATEAEIKSLSSSGKLARYQVVHFATHGLLAGDVEAMTRRQAQPALVLTPPKRPRDVNDDEACLTASEVAELKLNSDWVVLSACNTAAGNNIGGGSLSGLARALPAGTRSLLVSHWPVYSDAAVRLTTETFAQMARKATKRSRREKGERRIVNGIATFRFEAAGALLRGGDPKTAKAWCSGTLVGCDRFLTAAHCVADEPDRESMLFSSKMRASFRSRTSVGQRRLTSFPMPTSPY